MNKAELLAKKALADISKLNFKDFVLHLRRCPHEELASLLNRDECYGTFLHCLIKRTKPKQVVELGAAWGNSTIMMNMAMPKGSKFYSVDLGVIRPRWGNIDRYYPSLIRVPGNDLDLSIFPPDTELKDTDLWYIDSEHTAKQFAAELQTYSPFFHKGTVVVLDDIHLNDMDVVWEQIPYSKVDLSFPCRPDSGFGMFVVDDGEKDDQKRNK